MFCFLLACLRKEFKVKLIFPVTSLTWRETSNTLCLMEWHKASLRAGPDGFDRDQRGGKLVLRGRRLTRSPPLFQCVAWQPAFRWWGPNKAWRGVTSVHACWQPPTPAPPKKKPSRPPPLPPPCLGHPLSPPSWQRPVCLSTSDRASAVMVAGDCSCQIGLMTQSVWSNSVESHRGMLRMGLVSNKEGRVANAQLGGSNVKIKALSCTKFYITSLKSLVIQ